MRELLTRKSVKIFAAIIIIFAVGLVGFYIFSAPYGDGLETTMDEADFAESEPAYEGPLDYGENYIASLAFGIIGFIITLLVVFMLARLLKKNEA
ncbi:MAG: cobalt transporter [Thermoplasmata archaeon]|nr:cobalt transporter [Thermoplasmata archaeon]